MYDFLSIILIVKLLLFIISSTSYLNFAIDEYDDSIDVFYCIMARRYSPHIWP